MKRCMYCGHENDDSSQTCEKCGNQLMETPLQEELPFEDATGEIPHLEEPIPDIQIKEEDINDVLSAGSAPMPAVEEEPAVQPEYGQPYGSDPYAQQYADQEFNYAAQAEAQQQYAGQAYGYDTPPQYGPADNVYDRHTSGSGPIMKKARRRVRNPIAFIAVLIFTVSVIAEILNVALGNALLNISTVSHTITKMTGSNVAVDFMNNIVQMINGVNKWYLMGIGLAACIPSLLLMIGLWMAYASTTNKRVEISTAGYTMSKAAIIIKFIGVTLVLLAAIVFAVAFVVSAGAASSMMSLIAGVIVLLIMILVTVFAIMYYVQVLFAIKVIKTNVKTGMDIGKIPGFAIFLGFLGCACTVLSMLPMAPDDYIGLAAKGTYAAWLLLISLWALIYRLTVKVQRA